MNSKQFRSWMKTSPSLDGKGRFAKPLIMGILNLTPDSFSDGGLYNSVDKALRHALAMIEQGADLIDIGGESSRPGAETISLDEELSRVIPLIEKLQQTTDCCLSIDTCKPEVMSAAVAAGATLVNDIYALQKPQAMETVAALGVPVCLMHMQRNPLDMQTNPVYPEGILATLESFFQERLEAVTKAGVKRENCILDPGFGFGKLKIHNLQLLNQIRKLQQFKLPVLLGASRKSTIGEVLGKKIEERMIGSLAIAIYGALQGVGIIRAHDVEETNQALQMIEAICNPE